MSDAKKVTKAVILAAGFGTRMLPATKAIPKEMLPIVDKPVIQYIVEDAVAAGITDIIFVTGWHKKAVEDHFDRQFELEARLEKGDKQHELAIVRDLATMARFSAVRQGEQLGDGHAVQQVAHLLGDEPFVVTAADDILDEEVPSIKQIIDTYYEYGTPVVTAHRMPKHLINRYGVIAGEQIADNVVRVTGMVEKPSAEEAPSDLAAILRYVLTPEMLAELMKQTPVAGKELRVIDGAIAILNKGGQVHAREMQGTWYDIGSKFGFLKANIAYGLKYEETKEDLKNYLATLQ